MSRPTLQTIIDYYVNLLIIQYHDKPKAKATIETFIKELFANNLVFQLESAFDVDTAIGNQLSILAKYVGTARVLRGYLITGRQYFQIGDYVSVADKIGVRDYTTPRPEGAVYTFFYSVNSNSEYTITDEELRFVIKLLIIKNNVKSTWKNIKENIYNFFQEMDVYDNKDMSLTYITGLNLSNIIRLCIAQDYLFRPACVGLKIFSIKFPRTLFGFKEYTKMTANVGFSDYSAQNQGSFLSYDNLIVV